MHTATQQRLISALLIALTPAAAWGDGFITTGFEAAEGFVVGPIGGQHGWSVSSASQSVVSGGAAGSGQSLRLSQGSTADPRPLGLAFSPPVTDPTLVRLTLDTRIDDNGGAVYFVAAQSASQNIQIFRVEFDYLGHLAVLDPGSAGAVNGLVDTGVPWRANLWTTLEVTVLSTTVQYRYNGSLIYTGARLVPEASIEEVVLGHDNFQEFGAGAFSAPGATPAGYFDSLALAPAACYANCDASTQAPVLNVADFTCFLQKYASLDPYANCDASTTPPTLNVADFTCFLQKYAAGCP